MSVAGYFSKSTELRMPKQSDALGIQPEGPVLKGEKSVEQGRRENAIAASRPVMRAPRSACLLQCAPGSSPPASPAPESR